MLLGNGATPNAAGKNGATPLKNAAAKEFHFIAYMLLTPGAGVCNGGTIKT